MAQRQDQAWMPGGTPAICTNKSSDDVPSLEESQITLEEDSLKDEEEDGLSDQVSNNEEESVANDDELGLSESNVQPVDELGLSDAESELSNDDHETVGMDEENLSLVQYATMPRRCPRVAGKATVEPFVDADQLENYGAG